MEVTVYIIYNENPIASFTASSTNINELQSVSFNASGSSDIDGNIVKNIYNKAPALGIPACKFHTQSSNFVHFAPPSSKNPCRRRTVHSWGIVYSLK